MPQTLIPSVYLCGQALSTDTSAQANGLKNGYYYAVAVGATDAVGNVGPLATTCGEPQVQYDFHNVYLQDNGLAGVGYCSTDGVGVPGGTSALGVLFAATCAAMVRRRRRGEQ